MNHTKRLAAVLLLLSLSLTLCACASNAPADTTPTETTQNPVTQPAIETEPAEETTGGDMYQVTVVDEGGNPIAGAMVQLCLDTCYPNVTNAEGVAQFSLAEGNYKVTFLSLPAGYTYTTDTQEFYFEEGSREMTIVLKAEA